MGVADVPCLGHGTILAPFPGKSLGSGGASPNPKYRGKIPEAESAYENAPHASTGIRAGRTGLVSRRLWRWVLLVRCHAARRDGGLRSGEISHRSRGLGHIQRLVVVRSLQGLNIHDGSCAVLINMDHFTVGLDEAPGALRVHGDDLALGGHAQPAAVVLNGDVVTVLGLDNSDASVRGGVHVAIGVRSLLGARVLLSLFDSFLVGLVDLRAVAAIAGAIGQGGISRRTARLGL